MSDLNDYPDIDLATRNILSMIEIVVMEMGEAAKKAVEYPHLARPFMMDMIDFNNKMKVYKTKEIQR
ncbi:MAG TPA: hypothetical protein P5533_06045 [Candidatus Cloacimonadota bacterium]|nr:hypothetical protein [Candidatus Cloacimonadota bacterium]